MLKRARFGRSSEKLDRDIEQLELLIGELEEGDAESHARTAAAMRSARPAAAEASSPQGRQPLPDHLPREVVRHEPACACPGYGGTAFSKVGEDEREVLEYVPSHFKVLVHVRPKMSCRACETIVQAPMPSLPIERGRPGPLLLAHVAVAKYCDHAPLHRPSRHLRSIRRGAERSTFADWIGQDQLPPKSARPSDPLRPLPLGRLRRYTTDGRLEMTNKRRRTRNPPTGPRPHARTLTSRS